MFDVGQVIADVVEIGEERVDGQRAVSEVVSLVKQSQQHLVNHIVPISQGDHVTALTGGFWE